MAGNRFRLFRLPFLALRMITDFYGPYEIIQLSLCSKRSLRVAKLCWKKREKVEAYLEAEKIPKICLRFFGTGFYYRFVILEEELYFPRLKTFYRLIISKGKDVRRQRKHNIRVGDAVVPSVPKETETITFWRDKISGIEGIVRHIKDLCDIPITKIELKYEDLENKFIDTLDCIMRIQGSVKNCTLDTAGPIDECLTHLLDNCKITGNLWIYVDDLIRFKHNWNVHLGGLYLSEGLGFTFQNLTNINCEFLNLRWSSLSNEDANQFLKNWQNGGSPHIKFASIGIKSMNENAITSGIETVQQPETLRRSYPLSFPFMTNFTGIMAGGLDIRRNDGTIGNIFFYYGEKFDFGVDLAQQDP